MLTDAVALLVRAWVGSLHLLDHTHVASWADADLVLDLRQLAACLLLLRELAVVARYGLRVVEHGVHNLLDRLALRLAWTMLIRAICSPENKRVVQGVALDQLHVGCVCDHAVVLRSTLAVRDDDRTIQRVVSRRLLRLVCIEGLS